MRKDPTEFRERFKRWKSGELVYKDGLPHYEGGKDGTILVHDLTDDTFGGAPTTFPEIVVTGNKSKVKKLPFSYLSRYQAEQALRRTATYEQSLAELLGINTFGSRDAYIRHTLDLSKPLSPVDPAGEFVVAGAVLNPAFKYGANYLFGGLGDVIKEEALNLAGRVKPLRDALVAREMRNAVNLAEPGFEQMYTKPIFAQPAISEMTNKTIDFFDVKRNMRLVDEDGNVNMRNVAKLVLRIYKQYPDARQYKQIINSSGNLYDHTKAVVLSAQQMQLPSGVSRLELVESALIHDFGKILDRTISHDKATERIINDLGLVESGIINKSAVDAAAIHMDPGIAGRSNLARGLHFADVARGENLYKVLDENPHLAYPTDMALVNPELPRNYQWLLKNIINPLIERYGYKLSAEERSALGLPEYVEGALQIPLDVDENTARNAVLQILKKHRTFERTSHYPSSKFEGALKELASEVTGKPVDQITTEDMFDTSSQFIKNHGTNSGTMGLNLYLSSAQLDPKEYQALYTSTRDATAVHYARSYDGLPYRMDFVQMNMHNNLDWSLAELWANNEFPVVRVTGDLSKDMKLSNFRKYELPYILNTGEQNYVQKLAEIGKKYYRQSYIEAPDMPNYARPITDEPGKGGITLQKVGRNPNPEISRSRVENTAADVNDMLKQFGLTEVNPKIIKSTGGQEKVVSYTAYNKLYYDLDTIERIRLSLENSPAAEWRPHLIRNLFGTLYNNAFITQKLLKAALHDFNRHILKAAPPGKIALTDEEIFPERSLDIWEDINRYASQEEIANGLKMSGYDPLKYIGGIKQWASRAKSNYFKTIRQENSKNAFFKKRAAEKIVKDKAAKELFEDKGISPNYSLESPDGYRVFTTESNGFKPAPDPTYQGGSHYVIVGKRGSKLLNVVGQYNPTDEEVANAIGGSHGGSLSGKLSELSRNFGSIVLPMLSSWYLTSNLGNANNPKQKNK